MSRKFLTNIDMNKNQVLNLVLQQLGTDPVSPSTGQIWYNTGTNQIKYYNGTSTIILFDSATTNTASKLVLRDSSGNFSAGVGTFDSVTLNNSPSNGTDAATKSYVDATIQGLQPKGTSYLATATALPSNVYDNGSSGVGATLTASANAALSVDGIAVNNGDLILVKDEATQANNGLYVVTNKGSGSVKYILTRATNFDVASEISGGFVFVGSAGSTNNDTGWIVSSTGPYTIGTTNIIFSQFTGLGSVTTSAPLSKTGNVISLNYNARLVNSGGNLDLATSGVTAGQYALVTVDTYGRVTSATDIVSSNGIVVKTASGSYTNRSVAGTSGRVTVGNGDGVSGNPTIDLATSGVSAGTYYGQVVVDAYGRLTSAGDLISSNGFAVRTGSGTFTNRSITAGTGISISNGDGVSGSPSVTIDTSVVARKYSTTITGDNSTTAFTVTHNLNTTSIHVQIRDSSGNRVEVDDQANAVNTCVISYAVAPNNSTSYTVIVIG